MESLCCSFSLSSSAQPGSALGNTCVSVFVEGIFFRFAYGYENEIFLLNIKEHLRIKAQGAGLKVKKTGG